jgi:hypothetical protein
VNLYGAEEFAHRGDCPGCQECEEQEVCGDCGSHADDQCPGCGKFVCRACAEREGAFCCDGEGGEVAP